MMSNATAAVNRPDEPIFGVVDVGGTKILVGVATRDSLLSVRRMTTDAAGGADDVVKRIAAALRQVQSDLGFADRRLAGVGLSTPGPLDIARGIVHFTGNLHWVNYPVADRLSAELGGVRVLIDDDANCAGAGEAAFGAGKGVRDLIYLTLSTGIGGAILIDGHIYRGHQDIAGEVGHMTVVPDGPACTCGNYGCLEAVASGTAIGLRGSQLLLQERSPALAALVQEYPQAAMAELVFRAARQHDPACTEVIQQVAKYLGIGLANLVQVLNPQMIVLGGGVMHNAELLIPLTVAEMNQHLFKILRGAVAVVPAKLGDESGLWGALQLITSAAAPTPRSVAAVVATGDCPQHA
ncbi:MAG TPA: ROK family protein [Ktedonobacterales bacterium]